MKASERLDKSIELKKDKLWYLEHRHLKNSEHNKNINDKLIERTKELIETKIEGCGEKFMWPYILNDERICGNIEDLKHGGNIPLCDKCQNKIKEANKILYDINVLEDEANGK